MSCLASVTLMLLVACIALATVHAGVLTLPIEGRLEVPGNGHWSVWNQELTLNGDRYSTLTRVDGSFTFHDVTSGIYLLDVGSTGLVFPQMKIKVSAENGTITVVEYKYAGAVRTPSAHPMVLRAIMPVTYFKKKAPLSVIGMVTGNPMMLMMLVMLIVVVGFPSLLQGMSPEELKELKKSSSGDPMKEFSKLMGGGAKEGEEEEED
ncbi:hypothetical protein B484DRAFT_459766 [Ochromonadaceae sp. CCMP2298]|nr:hypothetical protein B484DRAFT_459766 [Ochromonadaceae sp. CCMP2298]|mmetsp:Transcript_23611/g.52459  ORF Transcript_23611/g.52459 Transcript_23611/m.52459 type:complete len:207 (-) Transcript_23611:238-858(-)|eukprot:CAMPEP_0173202652 /NCGR_PEP_ID=MMETSP1141-20130122/19092_1 /TAXON_ID=483371 /ORGANISM="non described non described, Strain CCMP2298" /LENGTH=206 /DNA_ID=CAMNT_0014128041 /DNA_START=40 /DNA_END=660 /DNA_ORIENTATION=-